jgi:hypothetical protein
MLRSITRLECAAMTCNAEINRTYPTREAAFNYLISRGFVCTTRGWENGRWSATVELDGRGYRLIAWLVGSKLAA